LTCGNNRRVMALVRILEGLVNSGFWRLAVCPLFLVGSRRFPESVLSWC
jgi:hypothetical protein